MIFDKKYNKKKKQDDHHHHHIIMHRRMRAASRLKLIKCRVAAHTEIFVSKNSVCAFFIVGGIGIFIIYGSDILYYNIIL